MVGRPKRKARLLRAGQRLPSWSERRGRAAPARSAPTARIASHEIIEGHPSQAPKASPGRGAPFCSSAGIQASAIAYHTGNSIARRHLRALPAQFRPGQIVVTEDSDDDGTGELYTVVASWCTGGRITTFIGIEGS